jgi:hypothetical protein
MPKYDIRFVAFILTTITYLIFVVALTRRLRVRHPTTWDRLDRFSLVANNSISSSWKFLRYTVFSRAHKELHDNAFDIMVFMLRVLMVIWGILFILNTTQV